jgi:hypothetical protein
LGLALLDWHYSWSALLSVIDWAWPQGSSPRTVYHRGRAIATIALVWSGWCWSGLVGLVWLVWASGLVWAGWSGLVGLGLWSGLGLEVYHLERFITAVALWRRLLCFGLVWSGLILVWSNPVVWSDFGLV